MDTQYISVSKGVSIKGVLFSESVRNWVGVVALSGMVFMLGEREINQKIHCIIYENKWTCVTGAHLQCVNNHYGKFEYIGIKSV